MADRPRRTRQRLPPSKPLPRRRRGPSGSGGSAAAQSQSRQAAAEQASADQAAAIRPKPMRRGASEADAGGRRAGARRLQAAAARSRGGCGRRSRRPTQPADARSARDCRTDSRRLSTIAPTAQCQSALTARRRRTRSAATDGDRSEEGGRASSARRLVTSCWWHRTTQADAGPVDESAAAARPSNRLEAAPIPRGNSVDRFQLRCSANDAVRPTPERAMRHRDDATRRLTDSEGSSQSRSALTAEQRRDVSRRQGRTGSERATSTWRPPNDESPVVAEESRLRRSDERKSAADGQTTDCAVSQRSNDGSNRNQDDNIHGPIDRIADEAEVSNERRLPISMATAKSAHRTKRRTAQAVKRGGGRRTTATTMTTVAATAMTGTAVARTIGITWDCAASRVAALNRTVGGDTASAGNGGRAQCQRRRRHRRHRQINSGGNQGNTIGVDDIGGGYGECGAGSINGGNVDNSTNLNIDAGGGTAIGDASGGNGNLGADLR